MTTLRSTTSPFPIPDDLRAVLLESPELDRSYLVGGCVRDWLLGGAPKDLDIEVFGLSYQTLDRALRKWGRTDLVGRSYGVVKLTMSPKRVYDFTLARRDSKVGPGHKGFTVEVDPSITPEEAAARRDYTINSMMYDPRTSKLMDFHHGRDDLQRGILRHTSLAFPEDPLRVLRGMQFAGRFRLQAAPETVELARSIRSHFPELPGDRVRDEWFKWAARSTLPSAGLNFLVASGWIEHFPELQALLHTPQDPEWHPEGDVFIHTCHCCDAMAALPGWQQHDQIGRIVYMLAILCHDLGKPRTTEKAERHGRVRIISPGHEQAGAPLTDSFLERIHAPADLRKRVLPLVTNHLAHRQTINERAVRRLAKRLEPETINGLALVISADHMGRPPKPKVPPKELDQLRSKAATLELESQAPKPILLGRHFLELGLPPGKRIGELVKAAFEAQLEGEFHDLASALNWLPQSSLLQDQERPRAQQLARRTPGQENHPPQ